MGSINNPRDFDFKGGLNTVEVFDKKETDKFKNSRLKKGIKTKVIYTYVNGEIPSDDMASRVKIDEKNHRKKVKKEL